MLLKLFYLCITWVKDGGRGNNAARQVPIVTIIFWFQSKGDFLCFEFLFSVLEDFADVGLFIRF